MTPSTTYDGHADTWQNRTWLWPDKVGAPPGAHERSRDDAPAIRTMRA